MAAPGQIKVGLSNANSVRSRRSLQREFIEVIHSFYNNKIQIFLKAGLLRIQLIQRMAHLPLCVPCVFTTNCYNTLEIISNYTCPVIAIETLLNSKSNLGKMTKFVKILGEHRHRDTLWMDSRNEKHKNDPSKPIEFVKPFSTRLELSASRTPRPQLLPRAGRVARLLHKRL